MSALPPDYKHWRGIEKAHIKKITCAKKLSKPATATAQNMLTKAYPPQARPAGFSPHPSAWQRQGAGQSPPLHIKSCTDCADALWSVHVWAG